MGSRDGRSMPTYHNLFLVSAVFSARFENRCSYTSYSPFLNPARVKRARIMRSWLVVKEFSYLSALSKLTALPYRPLEVLLVIRSCILVQDRVFTERTEIQVRFNLSEALSICRQSKLKGNCTCSVKSELILVQY